MAGQARRPRVTAKDGDCTNSAQETCRHCGALCRTAGSPRNCHEDAAKRRFRRNRPRPSVAVVLAHVTTFTIVGLGDRAVREARERVHAAILNSGFEFPARRVTVNLAPAYLRKAGPGFDLAIAAGVLAASGQLPADALERVAVFGELSLGGELRPCRG